MKDVPALRRLLAEAMDVDEPSFARPSDKTIEAYFGGGATPQQREEMLTAISRSSTFAREMADLAGSLDRAVEPEVERDPAMTGLAVPPPRRAAFLRWRLRMLASWPPISMLGISTRRHPLLSPALAAGAVAVLLGYPAFLGIQRLPREELRSAQLERSNRQLRRELGETRGGTASGLREESLLAPLRGVGEVHILREPPAGAPDAISDVTLMPGQDLFTLLVPVDEVLVALAPDGREDPGSAAMLPPGVPASYVLSIRSDARVVLEVTMSGTEIRARYNQDLESLPLVLVKKDMAPGIYDLRLVEKGHPDRLVLARRFKINP